jgi:ribosomal RNA-processing protein 12
MALIRSIDETNVTLLYRVIKPYLLDDTDPSMQKRAYAVLVSICEHHPFFVTSESNLKDMTDSLCESLLTCSIPAKKMRLRCLYHIITAMENCYLSKDNSITTLLPNHTELVPNLIGEIMLCTKEANGKAREAAFDLLLAMARLMHHTQPSNGLMEFLQMLLGGLAARTPHMRSAAVICLSRVVFEFGREEILIQQAMPQLMKTVLMLLHEKAREVIKSVIGFMKLGIAMLSKEQLRVFVPDIIQGLLLWIGESKNRFRAKTRIILIKLCRKYSYEEIAEIVPEKDRALIKHIKKTKEREEKKKQQHRQDNKSNSTINDAFTDFMKDDSDEDSDDDHPMYDENGGLMHEEDLTDGEDQYVTPFLKKKQTNKRRTSKKDSSLSSAGQWIKEDEDEIVDFLDSGAVRHLMSGRGQAEDDEEEDDGLIQVAKDGRFIINEPPLEDKKKSLKKNKDEDEDMVESDNEEASIKKDVAAQLQKMGFGNTSHNKRKREEETAGTGKEYKAKKAGGDIKKKGKLEPYAYIPLDPKLMAKRNKRIAVSKYNQVGGKKRQGNKKR